VFDDLIRTGQRQTPFTSRICRTILEHISLKVAETAVPLGTIGSAAFETYQQCRQLIEENYLRMESLEEIARPCNVDPAYLCRLFARFDHQSPYRYLMQLRMREAARRLAIPGTTAKQVAGEMGFGDPFHFSRVFRRVIGVSPRQFMQMQRPAPVR
jgi:AraC-like DNA-binding protein